MKCSASNALRLLNATITGSAISNLWQLLESYFGVDEDPYEAEVEDAVSIAELLPILKQENTEEPSFTKAQAQEEKNDKAEPDDNIESEFEESQSAFAIGSQTSGASGGKGTKRKSTLAELKAKHT